MTPAEYECLIINIIVRLLSDKVLSCHVHYARDRRTIWLSCLYLLYSWASCPFLCRYFRVRLAYVCFVNIQLHQARHCHIHHVHEHHVRIFSTRQYQ